MSLAFLDRDIFVNCLRIMLSHWNNITLIYYILMYYSFFLLLYSVALHNECISREKSFCERPKVVYSFSKNVPLLRSFFVTLSCQENHLLIYDLGPVMGGNHLTFFKWLCFCIQRVALLRSHFSLTPLWNNE